MSPAVVAFVLTAVLLPLAVSEFRDWCPRLATGLTRWAARRLGDRQARARYEEEWVANLNEVPGKLSPLVSAVGYLVAVPRMRWTLRRAPEAVTAKPRQLPPPACPLTARGGELAALDGLLAHRRKKSRDAVALTAAINGMAGVGKTTLALHWAQRIKDRFPDGNLYADLHSYSPRPSLAPFEVLGGFLHALGVQAVHVPVSLNERVSLYRSLVARRRMLVMLDNAATSDQVRLLLPDSPHSVVLITSRHRLSALGNAHVVDLDTLSVDEAMTLLREVAGGEQVDAEPQAARELVHLCACLPLAIHIAAGQLRRCPYWTISHLVDQLHNEQRPGGLARDLGNVRAAFDLSYQTLPADAQRLFRRLSTLPSPNFQQRQAARLAKTTAEETEKILDILANAQLIIARPEDDLYRTHDLLLAYARELLRKEEPSYQPTAPCPSNSET
jgi:hypothetical protein